MAPRERPLMSCWRSSDMPPLQIIALRVSHSLADRVHLAPAFRSATCLSPLSWPKRMRPGMARHEFRLPSRRGVGHSAIGKNWSAALSRLDILKKLELAVLDGDDDGRLGSIPLGVQFRLAGRAHEIDGG